VAAAGRIEFQRKTNGLNDYVRFAPGGRRRLPQNTLTAARKAESGMRIA
jgi:hypothetical protein